MEKSNLKKKFPIYCLCIIFSVCVIGCLIYYYNKSLKKNIMFSSSGCIFYGEDMEECEIIPLSVQGEKIYYLFKNRPDAIQGEIWINGYGIFGHGSIDKYDSYIGGMYNEFPSVGEYSYCGNFIKENEKIIYIISKDGTKGIVKMNSDGEISNLTENKISGPMILVFPACSREEGKILLDEMLPLILEN